MYSVAHLQKKLLILLTIIHILSSLSVQLMTLLPQYFIAIEQQLLLECQTLERAIFTMFAVHYVFNIEYHSKVKDVFYFLQEKVFGFTDTFKKSAIYLSVSSSIDLYHEDTV